MNLASVQATPLNPGPLQIRSGGSSGPPQPLVAGSQNLDFSALLNLLTGGTNEDQVVQPVAGSPADKATDPLDKKADRKAGKDKEQDSAILIAQIATPLPATKPPIQIILAHFAPGQDKNEPAPATPQEQSEPRPADPIAISPELSRANPLQAAPASARPAALAFAAQLTDTIHLSSTTAGPSQPHEGPPPLPPPQAGVIQPVVGDLAVERNPSASVQTNSDPRASVQASSDPRASVHTSSPDGNSPASQTNLAPFDKSLPRAEPMDTKSVSKVEQAAVSKPREAEKESSKQSDKEPQKQDDPQPQLPPVATTGVKTVSTGQDSQVAGSAVNPKAEVPKAAPASTPLSTAASKVELKSEINTSSSPQPAREISLHLPGNDSAGVDLKFTERAGKIQVTVRTPDTELAGKLQSDIGDLVGRLEKKGFETETWMPAERAIAVPAQQSASNNDSGERQQPPGGQQQQNGDAQQQGQQQRNRPRWVEELENGFSPDNQTGETKP